MNPVLMFLLRAATFSAGVTLAPQEAYRRQALQKLCGSTTSIEKEE